MATVLPSLALLTRFIVRRPQRLLIAGTLKSTLRSRSGENKRVWISGFARAHLSDA